MRGFWTLNVSKNIKKSEIYDYERLNSWANINFYKNTEFYGARGKSSDLPANVAFPDIFWGFPRFRNILKNT